MSSSKVASIGWRAAALGVSGAIILLALSVIVGWHTGIGALVQVFDGMVPMQYNTALCFLALAASGIAMASGARRVQTVCALLVAAMGLAVLAEYGSDTVFGIDTFFFYPWERALSANPGRMALTTAFSFMLTGAALAMLGIRPRAHALFGVINLVPASLALTSLVGYAFQMTYVLPYALGSQMALHTSVAFLAHGMAMLGYAWFNAQRGPDGMPRWSAAVGVALLPALLVGTGVFVPQQPWAAIPLGIVVAFAGIGLVALAVRKMASAKVAYKGSLTIAVPLALLLMFAASVAHVKRENESAQEWTLHSNQVVQASQNLLASVVESESAARGFVLTGDTPLLNAYWSSVELVAHMASRLGQLVSDNPRQQAIAVRLGKLATEKVDLLARAVDLIQQGGKTQAEELLKQDGSSALMAQLRREMDVFSDTERELGDQRQRALASSWQRLSWLLVSGTAAAILLAGLLGILFNTGISMRLKRLRDNARQLAHGGELAPPLNGHDEIAELDRVFHEMATSLKATTMQEHTLRLLKDQTTDLLHTEALLKTGALQSAIFNSANFSSIATDAKGVIQIFNVGAERMLGYLAAEVVNTITPADISDPQEVIARAKVLSLELGTPITPGFEALVFKASRGIEDIYELTYIRKDGSRFPAVVSVTALRDAADAIIGYLLIGTDNTARKHAEEALLKAGALQNAIFNSANFSSIATDAKGVIQIFNVGAERMLGYTAAEVMNKITPADISDPQEVIARAAALSAELATPITPGFEALVFKASRGIEDIYELTYIRKDGSRFPAVVSVTALRDAHDTIIGYLLIGTDNTARKQVEAAQAQLDQRLRDQQFYTRSLIESNIDALMTTDPQGIISDVNQQMIALTGRTRDELIGAPSKNFFTDPVLADAAIRRVLTEGKVSDYELTVRALDGTETVVSYNAATFHNRDRKLQGVFAAARDVTERKRFELALQEKNVELVHASRMKSEFLATMSHELRTPLNAIVGFSEALKDGLIGDMSDIQSEYIGDIFTSGLHLLSLINDILELSKVESGMMGLELEPVDIATLLSNSLTIVREKALAQRIRLELDTGDDLGIAQMDVRKTKQIVYNLLSNAVKFSATGTQVVLRARRVTRDQVGQMSGSLPIHSFVLPDNEFTEFLEVSVRDSGIGISTRNMAKLFQAFSQIDSSLARRFEGTGLGLAMVKQLSELQGGTVAVTSAEGEGACFAVWLPLRPSNELPQVLASSAADARKAHSPAAMASGRLALVVDDDDHAADLVRLLLEAEGFSVLRAASAEEALLLDPPQPLSLITLDIQLPDMSGWDYLLRIRDTKALATVPVVIVSGVADSQMGLTRGASAVLQKPISRAQLKISLVNLGLHPRQAHTHTIMVVDDDPKAIEVIAAFLPSPAYSVVRAHGGNEAIQMARQLHPDLILLDLMMPDVNGFDVVTTLHGSADTAAIPILVVTAKHITAQDRAALQQGHDQAISILPKAGFDSARFIAEVRRALLQD